MVNNSLLSFCFSLWFSKVYRLSSSWSPKQRRGKREMEEEAASLVAPHRPNKHAKKNKNRHTQREPGDQGNGEPGKQERRKTHKLEAMGKTKRKRKGNWVFNPLLGRYRIGKSRQQPKQLGQRNHKKTKIWNTNNAKARQDERIGLTVDSFFFL